MKTSQVWLFTCAIIVTREVMGSPSDKDIECGRENNEIIEKGLLHNRAVWTFFSKRAQRK
jgi:hypothetical protein